MSFVLRVTKGSTKLTLIVLTGVGMLLLGFGLALETSTLVGLLVPVLITGVVVLFARIFRVEHEPVVPPRAWWRMTGFPAAGFLLAVLFAAEVVNVVTQRLPDGGAPELLSIALYSLVTAAYVHSSIRLLVLQRAERQRSRAEPASRAETSGDPDASGSGDPDASESGASEGSGSQ